MISIIIAYTNQKLIEHLRLNVHETIGVDYEIVDFDNSSAQMGLCEVYNLGAKKAKFNLLCLMHEDIEIKTHDWGKKVVEIFNEQQPGILGVAGSTYKSSTPSGWFPPSQFGTASWRLNIEQDSKYEQRERKHDYYNPKHETLSEVTCVDGVWFCTTKAIALEHKFDQDLLKGFHGYDIDFSLNVGRKYKVLITFDILLYHASEGNFASVWLREMIKIDVKWNYLLPININQFTNKEVQDKERIALNKFLKSIIRNKEFSAKEISNLLTYYYKKNKINSFQRKILCAKVILRKLLS